MIIKNVSLDIVCGITSKMPETGRPEVAFAGKSNVGKSSLINGLMNRKSLARTSAAPGKTQTINFYNVNEAIYLVDLPGYGYAKASEEIKAKWGKMIEDYHGYEPVIIATKLDKIKRSQVQKQIKLVRQGLQVVPGTKIIPFSAQTKQGREEIWELIDELTGMAEQEKTPEA